MAKNEIIIGNEMLKIMAIRVKISKKLKKTIFRLTIALYLLEIIHKLSGGYLQFDIEEDASILCQ